ncbi:MAG: lipase [Clostridia bacterium]|nr:lipase [Clostridia bacterium]
MKKALKIIGIVVLVVVVLLVILFLVLANKPAVAKDYTKTVKPGGEIEAKYLQTGPYEVSSLKMDVMENFKCYEIWYPTEITSTDRKYPVVIFANGTGVKASAYSPVLEHLASWGFVVIGTEEEYSWNGFSCEMCLRLLLKINEIEDYPIAETNPFYGKIDLENVGLSGHSQGGVGVINAATDTTHKHMYKTIFAASPANMALAHNLEWDYDVTGIEIPVFLASSIGDADENLVVNLEGLREIYEAIPSDTKLMLRRNDADHGDMLSFADGYMTAWFLWQLQGDVTAALAFVGDEAEIWNNNYYQDIDKNF